MIVLLYASDIRCRLLPYVYTIYFTIYYILIAEGPKGRLFFLPRFNYIANFILVFHRLDSGCLQIFKN